MVCTNYGSAIVCGPPGGVYKRKEIHCPECHMRHGAVETWDGAWYGTTTYGACGDKWMDGQRAPRPFLRYWRRNAQAKFQAMWDNAAPEDLYEAYARADVDVATSGDREVLAAIERRNSAHEAILAHQASKGD